MTDEVTRSDVDKAVHMSEIAKPNNETDETIGGYRFNIGPYTKGDVSNFVVTEPEAGPDPTKNECVSSPNFYRDICKAVNVSELPADTGSVVRPVYFRWSNTSSDGALYTLNKNGETPPGEGKGQLAIFRSSDNALVHVATEVSSHESNEFRFDRRAEFPRRMYYVSGCSFYRYDITGDVTGASVPGSGVAGVHGTSTLIRDFSETFGSTCSLLMNDVEGESSNDSRYWAWELIYVNPNSNNEYEVIGFITYDMETDKVLGTLDQATFAAAGGVGTLPRPNMVEISPLGTKVIVHWDRADDQGNGFKMPAAYPLNLDVKQYQYVGNASTHSGWAFDLDGSEMFISQIDNSNWADAEADTITAVSLKTGAVKSLISPCRFEL